MYGYIPFTAIERALFDERVTQRLRHIAQSGLAHYVYPEVRTSRFAHSLGAMHLASRFLATSLENAQPHTSQRIETALRETIDELYGLAQIDPTAVTELTHVQGIPSAAGIADSFEPYLMICRQGLRLAALFHDLGHLPFSHDFEYALEELLREPDIDGFNSLRPTAGELAVHERIGYQLADLLCRKVFGELLDLGQPQGRVIEVAFRLSRQILQAVPYEETDPDDPAALGGPIDDHAGVLQWLHSIVAGELDVDRSDYLLRDGRHYGFEFVSFDLDRLVDNLVVVSAPEILQDHGFLLAVLPQGQTAAESFVIARFRMYQWGIRHHKAAQAATALRFSIKRLLQPALRDAEHPLRPFLDDLESIASSGEDPRNVLTADPELLNRFAGYDDPWWLLQLRHRIGPPTDIWLELVCFRAPGPISLWKRVLDFPVDDIAAWNALLPERGNAAALQAWATAVEGLAAEGVLVARHNFVPWKRLAASDESAIRIYHHGVGLVPLSRTSPIIRSLQEAWLGDIQVHAFKSPDSPLTKEEVIARLPSNQGG